jgi:hypothetical protein
VTTCRAPSRSSAACCARAHRGDFGATLRRQLDRELAHAARAAGDQYALRGERFRERERAQDREAGDRQRRRDRGFDGLRHDCGAHGGHGGALRPSAGVQECGDASAGGGARAIRRGRDHRPGDVPSRRLAVRRAGGAAHLTAVERDGLDREQQLVRTHPRLRHVDEGEPTVLLLPGFHGA